MVRSPATCLIAAHADMAGSLRTGEVLPTGVDTWRQLVRRSLRLHRGTALFLLIFWLASAVQSGIFVTMNYRQDSNARSILLSCSHPRQAGSWR
jgi:hypothetical protein